MIGWTFKLQPFENELLSSFLIRESYAHGVCPHSFCSLHYPEWPIWNRDIDRNPPTSLVQLISCDSSLSVDSIKALTFSDYLVGSGITGKGNVQWLLALCIWHRKRLQYGLLFCPKCISESTPYFRMVWRMAFSVSCSVHGLKLLESCSKCGEPLAPHRAINGQISNCHACSHPYALEQSEPIESTWVEESLSAAFLEEPISFAGYNISGIDWLVGCRMLISLILHRQRLKRILPFIGISPEQAPNPQCRYIEGMRTIDRIKVLTILEQLLLDWPETFLNTCKVSGITIRSFARVRKVPLWLGDIIVMLPKGQIRQRKPTQIFGLSSLRQNVGNWREKRAKIILSKLN